MAYQWPVDVRDLFGERYQQIIGSGLPAEDVDAVRGLVTMMWPDEPGGWVHEWSALAARHAEAGAHRLAALAYGWASFPALTDRARRTALARQAEQYQLAAPDFGVDFGRRVLSLPHRGGTTPVPVHVLAPHDLPADAPVLLASGGVDTWKMDLHPVLTALAVHTRMRVVAFDIPGTGESAVAMTPDGGAQITRGLIDRARTLGNGVVAHLGISMGGHYSARTGLSGEVDAAVVVGGPVDAAFTEGGLDRFGMSGIVGNALGFDREPADGELASALSGFSLRSHLARDANAPMLVVNGADDVHVPQHDTLVFRGRRATEVRLIPGSGHCAVSAFPEVLRIIVAWLARTLGDRTSEAHA